MPATKKKKSTVNKAGNYTKPTSVRTYLIKLKREVRAVRQGSGQHERLRCLLKNTKLKEAGTNES